MASAKAFLLICATAASAVPLTPVSVRWTQCSDSSEGAPPGLECGKISVPLNWSEPSGKKISLGLTRVPSTNPDKIGSLIYNPGGPGEPANEAIAALAMGLPAFSEALRNNFDIVGMDPRGVGASTPVLCDPEIWNEPNSWFPQTEEEFDAMLEHNERVWKSCKELSGDLLGFIDTVSVAKDLDAVRQAVGDEKLTFMGASYGTQIGQTYAQLYPDGYRALALDGMVDHDQLETDPVLTEASTYNEQLERFAVWCQSDVNCLLEDTDVIGVWSSMLAQADAEPIAAPLCNDTLCKKALSGENIRQTAQGSLTYKNAPFPGSPDWTTFAQQIAEAAQGNASLFSATLGVATSQKDKKFAGPAIACLDWNAGPSDFERFQAEYLAVAEAAPLVGATSQSHRIKAQCIGYPFEATNLPGDMTVKNRGKTPILLVHSRYDPATSLKWAESVLSQIEEVRFVLRDGDGHTSYMLQGESMKIIDDYLIDLKLPEVDVVYT